MLACNPVKSNVLKNEMTKLEEHSSKIGDVNTEKQQQKKGRYQRQRWWSWANIWSRKIPGKWRCALFTPPPAQSSQYSNQSPTSLSFVLTKKSWQTIFVGLSSNAIYETFFCNELDTVPATRIPAIAWHWIFKLYGIMDTIFPVLLLWA